MVKNASLLRKYSRSFSVLCSGGWSEKGLYFALKRWRCTGLKVQVERLWIRTRDHIVPRSSGWFSPTSRRPIIDVSHSLSLSCGLFWSLGIPEALVMDVWKHSSCPSVCFSIMSGISPRDSQPPLGPSQTRSARVCGKHDRRTGKPHHSSAYNLRQQSSFQRHTPAVGGSSGSRFNQICVVSAVSLSPAWTRLQTANYWGFSPGSCSGIGNRRRFPRR